MKSKLLFFCLLAICVINLTACNISADLPAQDTQTPSVPTATSPPPTATATPEPALDPSAEPVHGVLELAHGFRPNPVIQQLLYGGTLDLGKTPGNSTCSGYAESAPDLAVDWADEGFVRFFFIANQPANTSLTIQDPLGDWHCADDSFDTLNPTIDFDTANTGRFNIWVGGQEPDQKDLGKLYVTQVEEIDPTDLDFSTSVQGKKLQRDAPARTAEINLIEGFSPDPMVIEMVAGGPVDLNLASEFPVQSFDLGDEGFTNAEPDVRIHWQGSGYLKIFFVADNGVDTFLFIKNPNAIDNLNDTREYYGVIYEDPLLEFMSTFNGTYNVWVPSFSHSVLVPGKLYITSSTDLYPGNPGD